VCYNKDASIFVKKYRKHIHQTLKRYFIPHRANNYHPHILHTKRAVFYSLFFVLVKAATVGFALLAPVAVLTAPDVLAEQSKRIVELTNAARKERGLPALARVAPLNRSADLRAEDMSGHSYFSHESPDGHGLEYFLGRTGYSYAVAGENLAMGFSDAESVVRAWKKSATHYENIVDRDFVEFGVGMEAGVYEGRPTVYVAQHFGTPYRPVAGIPAVADVVAEQITATSSVPFASVAGVVTKQSATTTTAVTQSDTPVSASEEIRAVASTYPVYDRAHSRLSWQDISGGMRLRASVVLFGDVERAFVTVQGRDMELERRGDVYEGSLALAVTPEEVFRVIVPATLTIVGPEGSRVQKPLDWEHPLVVSQTPWERYAETRDWLSPAIPLFDVANALFAVGLVVFILALLLNIFIEIRKQHPHVIVQTVGVIGLLLCLWVT